jgi:DNA repair exonuclease SbcCD ATPase subunit
MRRTERNGEGAESDVARFDIENVGGIESTAAELEPGVTVLTGRNATNRTSFLQAIMAACGSENASLKADAEAGRVGMSLGGRTYERRLYRRGGTVGFDGDPYLDDPTLADLFAFLLEDNPCRRAVARSADLREIIMRPVDTGEIEREIRSLTAERDDIDRELDRLDSLADERPDLDAERRRLEDEIESTRATLRETRERFDDLDAEPEEGRTEGTVYEEKIEELGRVRDDVRELDQRIESERRSIESLEREREERRQELDDVEAVPDDRLADVERQLQRLRGRRDELDATVEKLNSVVQFNREFLDDGTPDVLAEGSDGGVTDELVDGETVVCWTCGSDVDRDRIEATLDQLESVREETVADRRSVDARIEELKDEQSRLERRGRERERLRRKLDDIEAELDERRDRIDRLSERKADLEREADALEADIADLEDRDHDVVLDLHEEVNRLEFDLDQLESDLAETEARLQEVESELERREPLERERADLTERITELRTRVTDLQEDAIAAFNEHMAAVLDQLAYERIERIWIERVGGESADARFELHIVRSTDGGAVYEDTVDHLSESEREVTGLVFALAGYLVHEVYERVPFMLLDSIEAIDSDRIARLVEYLSDYATFLVVAVLEEDARAIDDAHTRIESI